MIIEQDVGDDVFADTSGAAELLAGQGFVNANGLIRSWKVRGLLAPVGYLYGRPVYSMADVYDVERKQRESGKGRPRLITVGGEFLHGCQ